MYAKSAPAPDTRGSQVSSAIRFEGFPSVVGPRSTTTASPSSAGYALLGPDWREFHAGRRVTMVSITLEPDLSPSGVSTFTVSRNRWWLVGYPSAQTA